MGREIIALVDLIYESALNPQRWPAFLNALADDLGGSASANLFVFNHKGPTVDILESVRIDPSSLPRYQDYYIGCDVWLQRMRSLPADSTVTGSALLPSCEFMQSEFYDDFLRHLDIYHVCSAKLMDEESKTSVLSIYRPSDKDDFSPAELRFVHALSPHLRRAVQMHLKMGSLAAQNAAMHEALDRIAGGVVFVSADASVLQMNRAAEEMVRQNDGLSVRRGRLTAAHAQETAELRDLITQAADAASGVLARPGGEIALSRPSLRRALAVIVCPFRSGTDGSGPAAARPCACVFVTDPEREVEVPVETVVRLYGVTQAEARIALGLAGGRRLEDLADQFGITLQTARSQLKQIYAKTGTHRQAELVRLMLTGPAGLIVEP